MGGSTTADSPDSEEQAANSISCCPKAVTKYLTKKKKKQLQGGGNCFSSQLQRALFIVIQYHSFGRIWDNGSLWWKRAVGFTEDTKLREVTEEVMRASEGTIQPPVAYFLQ